MATSGKGPVGRPRTFDREHVIAVAVESYWRDGVHGISINEICRRASVSKPGLYREFGGEDGLIDAALVRYAQSVLEPNFKRVSEVASFAMGVATLIELMTDTERTGPAGCLLVKMQHAPERLGPATRQRVHELRSGALAGYAAWIDRAKDQGEIPSELSTDVAVALVDVQCTTLLTHMAIGTDPQLLRAQARLALAGLTGDAVEPPML